MVELRLLVSPEGVVEGVKVFRNTTDHPALPQLAISAARDGVFDPAIGKDGNPVSAWIRWRSEFGKRHPVPGATDR